MMESTQKQYDLKSLKTNKLIIQNLSIEKNLRFM